MERSKSDAPARRNAGANSSRRAAACSTERSRSIPEDVAAHYNLALIYDQLGDQPQAAEHRRCTKVSGRTTMPRDRAIALARRRDKAADHAAESIVIYPLQRPARPTGLPQPMNAQ